MAKQVVVLRKDLNMRKGKFVTQGGHGIVKVFFDRATITPNDDTKFPYMMHIPITQPEYDWKEGIFKKIAYSVNSEQELFDIQSKCQKLDVPYAMIQDCGLTEFHGIPTWTCIAVGPDEDEKIDIITGGLPLL